MGYGKVALTESEARKLYKEDLTLSENNRILFRKMRYFQEFYGASTYEDGLAMISKGMPMKVGLELPAYVPMRTPLLNWFQIAMRNPVASFRDPLELEARYKGFLPCYFVYDQDAQHGLISVDDDPNSEVVDYALFIYDRANYGNFMDEVQNVLTNSIQGRAKVARDVSSNTIMVSDSMTDQAMLLMPMALLAGKKAYAQKVWREVIKSSTP